MPGFLTLLVIGQLAVRPLRRVMRVRYTTLCFSFAASLFVALLCCSCSMVLVNTVPTKTGAALRPGAGREELIARLGQPQSSSALSLTPTAFVLRTNQQPVLCDFYRVSGLVQIHGDPYATDWNVYPAFVIITLGLAEVVMFPYVCVDMAARSFRRYEFLTWYNEADELIAYERRKHGHSD